MRPAKHSYNFNPPVQAGKFLEGALVGRPRKLEMKADQVSDMREMRRWLKRNIRSVMDEIRTKQADDPAMPKHPFAKNLMMDIEGELEDYADGNDRYEVRIQSAVDTVLDYAGWSGRPEYQEMVQAAVSRFKTAIALQKPN